MNQEPVSGVLEFLMGGALTADIPLLVGTCGTCGTDAMVNWTRDIALEVASDLKVTPKIACLYSEQLASELVKRNRAGQVLPLPPLGAIDDAVLESCTHIVALMGPDPYITALRSGAQIILGGRTTDTADLPAMPLLMEAD